MKARDRETRTEADAAAWDDAVYGALERIHPFDDPDGPSPLDLEPDQADR